jgi:hypothetical protein
MPTESYMPSMPPANEWWTDPAILWGIGGTILIITIAVWGFTHPERCARIWKTTIKFLRRALHSLLVVRAFVVTFALILAGIYWYFPEAVVGLKNSSPELYNWAIEYAFLVFVVFLGLNTIGSWASVIVHSDREDDGIINDIDAEKAIYANKKIIDEHSRVIGDMSGLILELQNALYEHGNRFEVDPKPPVGVEERRKIVKANPSIAPTIEDVAKIIPLPTLDEPSVISLAKEDENDSNPQKDDSLKKDPEAADPYKYGKFDSWLLKKK